jgi:hypothetical protein
VKADTLLPSSARHHGVMLVPRRDHTVGPNDGRNLRKTNRDFLVISTTHGVPNSWKAAANVNGVTSMIHEGIYVAPAGQSVTPHVAFRP